MVGKEAWNSMMAGKKVRCVLWPENEYIYFDKKEYKIKNSYGIETIFYVSDIVEDVWELYEDDVIEHYGRPHERYTPHSGRYAWGSDEDTWELYKDDERSNIMNFEEARKALLEGKKVRCVDWIKNRYVYFDDKNLLVKSEVGIIQTYGIIRWEKHEWEIYEEPKKVIKVFISQPMRGRTKCEIYEERNRIKSAIEKKYGKKYQIEYLNEDWNTRPKDWSRIQNLGYSIMNMYDANIVVFAPDWNDAEGCIIEHNVAFYCEKKFYVCVVENNEYILY